MKKENKVSYYLIQDRIIARREINGNDSNDYLLRDGKWVEDSDRVIEDHLDGCDPSKPEDFPLRSGTTVIPAEMIEISRKKAVSIINQQILDVLKNNWKVKFADRKEKWDADRGWPAKLVETRFKLNGINYTLYPTDIGLTDDGWDQGFMESIQKDIIKDLEEYGAVDIYNLGFID